ncbi:MAG: hypothetical protein JW904_03255 [Spirochaetales bacterium]|nr:hypothetical protein [Spirochaetales bacterium]
MDSHADHPAMVRRKKILILLIIGAVVAVSFSVFTLLVEVELVNLKHSFFREFSKETGLTLTYENISPSLFSRLEIRGLSITTADAEPRELLSAQKLVMYYNPLALIFEGDKLYAIKKIETLGIRLNLDEKKDKKLVDFFAKIIFRDIPDFTLPPIEFVGKNLGITYTREENEFSFNGLFFTITPDGEWFSVNLHSDGRTENTQPGGRNFFLNSEFDMTGSLHKSVKIFDAQVNFQNIESTSFAVNEQQFDVRLENSKLVVTKIQDHEPLDLSVVYAIDEHTVALNFISEGYSPARTLLLRNGLEGLNPFLKTTVTSKGNVRYDIEANDLEYRLDVDGFLPDEVVPVQARIKTRVTGDNTSIAFEPFAVTSQIGSIQFVGNILYETMFPKGSLQLRDLETKVAGKINADLDVDRTAQGLSLAGDRIMIGSAQFDQFLWEIFPVQDNYLFTLSTQLSAARAKNSIVLNGNLNLEDQPLLSLDTTVQNIPLDIVYRAVSASAAEDQTVIGLLDDMYITASASFSTDFKTVQGKSERVLIVQQEEEQNTLVFDVEFDTQQVAVNKFSGNWKGMKISGDFHLKNTDRNIPHFLTRFSVRDTAYMLEGDIIPDQGVIMSGTYGLLASLIQENDGTMVFFVNADALPIPVNETTLVASLRWAGVVTTDGSLEIAGQKTTISGFPQLTARGGAPVIDAAFVMRNGICEISQLGVKDAISALNGNGTFSLDYEAQFGINGWFYLADQSQQEVYSGSVNYREDDISAQLVFSKSPLARFGDIVIRGSLNGAVLVSGNPVSPEIEGVLSLENGRFGFEPVTANAEFTLNDDIFLLNSFSGSYSDTYSINTVKGEYNRTNGQYSFEGAFNANYNEPLTAKLTLAGSTNPVTDTSGSAASPVMATVSGELRVQDILAGKKELSPWRLIYSLDDSAFSIAGGPDNTIYGALLKDGSFKISFADPFPLQGTLAGKIEGNNVDARADDVTLMITGLNALVNNDALVFYDGIAKGNITITGPLSDPDLFGVFTIDKLSVGSKVLPEPVGPINTVLQINEKALHFKETNTYVGRTPVTLSTDLVMDHWNVSQYMLNVKVLDERGIHVVVPAGPATIDGFVVSPNFTLMGSYAGLRVAGDLFVQNCNVILAKQEETAEEKEARRDFNVEVDLNIETGKQVEMFWPARELPILRLVAVPGAKMMVKYNKLKDDLVLTGDFDFNNGDVYYFERGFHVREGHISLNENAQTFDPLLSLRAERRVRYNEKDVKIIMQVDNQRLSGFEPTFESDPPLPITERYLALGGIIQSQQDNASDEYISSVISDIGGDLLTQLVLLRPLEQKVKEIFDLDGFSIRTELIKNLLRDTLFTSSDSLYGAEPISMGRYLNNTEISFQKYLDEQSDLFVEVVFRIQSDTQSEGTSVPASENFGNVSVESEVSIELTTPFFLTIKWTVTPEHWESFFLPDNKITLKWGMVF